MSYPLYFDKDFDKKIKQKKEIYSYKIQKDLVKKKCLEDYQYIVSNLINPKSPYYSLLLYMETGTGKTFSAISIAENFIRSDKSKVLVITKSKTLIENFISDLINICSPYVSEKEKEILEKGTKQESSKIRSIVRNRINRHYSFVTYNYVKSNEVDFKDKVVIVDEIHNLLGNTGYDSLMKFLVKTKNTRLVLLSATPVYDKTTDIFQLSNLLNFKEKLIGTSDSFLTKQKLVSKSERGSGGLLTNSIYSITKTGMDFLLKKLKGKVFYMKVDTKSFPSVSYPNSVKKIGDYELSLGVVRCDMKGKQEEYYSEEAKFNADTLSGVLESMSGIIYPDFKNKKYFGKAGMDFYIKKRGTNTDFLLEKNILNYSTKLYHLLQNIKKSPGKIYIHSSSITDDGVPIIRACLLKNGYKNIMTITSETEDIEKNISTFNSPSNDNGSKIKILLGSNIISEGITLKNVRQVHIYEPAWNYSTIDQIKGRAIRKYSHSRLPVDERTVEVYLYCACSTDISRSIDVSKYYLSSLKDKEIKKIERSLAKSAFSCSLTKERNVVNGVDYSRECDYSTCDYECDDNFSPTALDKSTYDLFSHDKEIYEEYASKILEIFSKTTDVSIKDLSIMTGLDEESIKSISSHLKLNNRGGILSYPKKTSVFIARIPKLKRDNEVRGFVNESGVFSLEVKKALKSNIKVCETGFSKAELLSIVKSLNIPVSAKETKSSLCNLLKNYYS